MTRWEPNARGRLAEAALELFAERGFEQTTVDDIATRAGLTKRTFFRHFADKREVLFGGGDEFRDGFVSSLAAVPASAPPMDAIAATLEAVAATFRDRREFARRRQEVIAANPALQERELVKLASVTAALVDTLRERGVAEPGASVTAETVVAIFRNAFERWVAEGEQRELAELIHESLEALRAVAGSRS
jgi:AcrR family transcriptional regulator